MLFEQRAKAGEFYPRKQAHQNEKKLPKPGTGSNKTNPKIYEFAGPKINAFHKIGCKRICKLLHRRQPMGTPAEHGQSELIQKSKLMQKGEMVPAEGLELPTY